jgi:hypothetical protein
MMFKILSWNVRGLNEEAKRLRVRNLLSLWKVDIVCLQETKISWFTPSLVHSLWRCPYVDWCFVAAEGASGGILLMWDRRVVSKIDVCLGSYVAACSFRNVEDGLVWAFAGVYGPNRDNLRRRLWEELAGLMSLWDMPWCIGGDFNVTLYHSERSGVVTRRRAVAVFADFIEEQGLMNLPLSGGISTWSNSSSWSRLDRFLVSTEWDLRYPDLMQRKLTRVCSDHAPILLGGGIRQGGKRPFKFENMWLKEEGFVEKVRSWWGSFSFWGSPSFVLAKKLKALKGEIKRWSIEEFGNVEVRNKAWAEELKVLDRIEEERGLSEEEKERRRALATDLEVSLLQEEISWRQKSRVRWLKEGDRCTKFFHQVANANRRKNYIESLVVNGSPTSDTTIISDHIVGYYESLFAEPMGWRPRLDNLEFDRLNEEEASNLEEPFEEKEVWEVIKGMDRDKASGPDGFTLAFFQDCWGVVKEDFMAVFAEFHDRGKQGSSEPNRVNVSHLLFADDTLVFCEANESQIRHVGALLVCFEAVAGLKVNLSKSALIPVGLQGEVDQLAGMLGCGRGDLPLKYLGLPLGAPFKLKAMWADLEDLMARRLAPWKRLYLSKGARVTLIKSTLSNLPTYMLSLFPIPAHVAKRIEKIQRDFLWGGMNDESKFHLVEWAKVCSPIDEGGLGIRDLRRFNQALLGKWLWRFAHEEGAWWRSVLVAKYGSVWGGWHTGAISSSHGVGLWKYICMGWQNFKRHTRFDPGEGSRIRFWDDVWCGDRPLKEAFPGLFNIARLKEASIADNVERANGVSQWNIQFLRLIHDWEVEVLASFYHCLYSCKLREDGGDKLWWVPSRKGGFEVKSFYRALSGHGSISFPWKSIWRSKAPPRVAFFAWTAARGKILTLDNLSRRGLVVVNRCWLCEADGESVDHLLLHCRVARALWDAFFSRFGLCWVMPSTVKDLYASWWTGGRSRSAVVWKMVLLCIMWCIWRERNDRCFEDKSRSLEELLHLFFRTLFTWTAGWLAPRVISFSDFLSFFSLSP